MDYKSKMVKIKRYSHSLRKILNVLYLVVIVGACGALIASIVISLMPDSAFMIGEKSIGHTGFSLDGLIRYELNQVGPQTINMKGIYTSITIMSIILFGLSAPVLKQLVLILKTVEEDKPFSIENANRISIFGVVLIVCAFIVPAIELFIADKMIDTLRLQNITTNYSVNVVLILTGLMMFILSGIFKYGSYLQHEYDETV